MWHSGEVGIVRDLVVGGIHGGGRREGVGEVRGVAGGYLIMWEIA